MIKELTEARMIAEEIREEWHLYQNVYHRERKAATLLLALADEIERLRPELKVHGE